MYVVVLCVFVCMCLKTNDVGCVCVGVLTGAEASGGVVSSDERGVGESGVEELKIVWVYRGTMGRHILLIYGLFMLLIAKALFGVFYERDQGEIEREIKERFRERTRRD